MEKPTLSITIAKPCHEDWNKFTPDEKGAFCGSCQKSVYDFTNKTDDEIAQVFAETKGTKICGRFNTTQLDRPIELDIPLYAIQRPASPVRAFAMAAFLIFGTILFNCQTSDGQVLGQMTVITKPPVKKEQMVKGKPSVNDKIVTNKGDITPNENIMMGGPRANWNVPVENTTPVKKQEVSDEHTKGNVTVCKTQMKGEVMIQEIPKETIKKVETPVTPIDTLVPEKMPEVIMGKIAFIPRVDPEDELINIDPFPVIETEDVPATDLDTLDVLIPQVPEVPEVPVTNVDTIWIETAVPDSLSVKTTDVPNDVIVDKKAISIEVMPNPSNGEVTLRYILKEKNMTQIELYNMEGVKVKTLLGSQNLYEGTYNTGFDISELPDGTYFCKLISGERSAISKIILSR